MSACTKERVIWIQMLGEGANIREVSKPHQPQVADFLRNIPIVWRRAFPAECLTVLLPTYTCDGVRGDRHQPLRPQEDPHLSRSL